MSDRAAVRPPADSPPAHAPRRADRPLIVELVGPAGAGKTSLLQSMLARDPSIRPWRRFRRLQRLPIITRHAVALAPAAWDLLRTMPGSLRLAVRHLLRLRTLESILSEGLLPARRAIVLDEGPVYSLCRLGLMHQSGQPVPHAWDETVRRWPGPLDMVVWLDAPNHVLAQRIRRRTKHHDVKHRGEHDVYEFLERFRRTYREILDRWSATSCVQVIAIDTAAQTPETSATQVLEALERLSSARATGW